MNGLHNVRSRPWMLIAAVIGFLAVHGSLFYILRHSRMSHVAVSGTVISGVVLLMIAKHVGLLASVLRWLFRRANPDRARDQR
jgi:hypothetical protein